jgi:hypothetical protein
MAEELNDDGAAEAGQSGDVGEPLRAAGKHPVHQQQVRTAGAVNFVMRERLVHLAPHVAGRPFLHEGARPFLGVV